MDSRFPPTEDTFRGTIMLRLAGGAGFEDTDELADAMAEAVAEFSEIWPDDDPVAPQDVPDVVLEVFDEYRRVVTDHSDDVAQLEEVRGELLVGYGIVYNLGLGYDTAEAVDIVSDMADALREEGHHVVRGYAYSHQQDVDRMILTGTLPIGFGTFTEDGEGAAQIGEDIVEVLREVGLPAVWNGSTDTRIEVTPIDYRIAYREAPAD